MPSGTGQYSIPAFRGVRPSGHAAASPVKVIQAYRFALDPSPAQERSLRSHAGASRFAWNWGLARVRERYAVEGKWYSGIDLHKLWNAAKKVDPTLAWWSDNSKCVYQEAFNDLYRALRDFDKSRKGFPALRSAGSSRSRWRSNGRSPERHARPGSAIGVDLGVKTLLTGVDDAGNTICIDGSKALRAGLRKLRRASRAHSRKVKDGANRRKHADRLARIYARIANVRADALRKATSGLAARYETVVAEDLNVTGMLTNHRLARAVADQGFGQARRMLSYKTIWNGGTLLVADRWYPSSKTCSACGWRKPSLKLAERRFTCEACGLVMDRDQNAARNLLALRLEAGKDPGTARRAGTGPGARAYACGDHVRPGPAGQWPQPRSGGRKQEPGTAYAGQTGTAGGQPTAVSHMLASAHRLTSEIQYCDNSRGNQWFRAYRP